MKIMWAVVIKNINYNLTCTECIEQLIVEHEYVPCIKLDVNVMLQAHDSRGIISMCVYGSEDQLITAGQGRV
jgi:hypothetical protein